MVIRVDVTRYFPDVTPVEEKVREMRASLRQKISLSLLNAMSLVRNTMHKRDIEDYFYDTTGIFLSRMQTAECRRDDNGNVTMIRLETPTGQMKCFKGSQARILREAISVYAPRVIVEEK